MIWLLKRLLATVPVVVGVICISFFLIHMIPGDPIETMLGDHASIVNKEALRKELGLDKPLPLQFKLYLQQLVKGDLGHSLMSRKPVTQEILDRAPATLELAIVTLLISFLIGIPLGVWASLKKGTTTDRLLLTGSMAGLSMPAFWLGPVLIWLFALHFNWLPVSERGTFGHVILPAVTLSSGIIAIILRMTRTSMLQVLKEDYIRVAQAKGAPQVSIYYIHALANAIFPLITIFGFILGSLLTGTVVIETIFDWPGLGTLVFEAIQQRDYPLVQGCVLVISLVYVSVNFVIDILYQVFNPQVVI